MFGSQKILIKEKRVKENGFLMFSSSIKNIKNKIKLKLVRRICIFKLLNIYIKKVKLSEMSWNDMCK